MARTNYSMQHSGFRKAEQHYGGHIYGMFPGCGGLIRVTKVVTTTTVFEAELLQELGEPYGNVSLVDMFNNGWAVKGIQCGQAGNEGLIRDITDFDETNGKVTTVAMSATYTVGDILWIAPIELLIPIGASIVLHKGSTITPTTAGAGVALSGAASGSILVEELAVQKITGTETANVTSILLISDDTVPLNQKLIKQDGTPLIATDLVLGSRFVFRVNWKLATTKILKVKTTGANGTAGYLWTVKCSALSEGATLLTA